MLPDLHVPEMAPVYYRNDHASERKQTMPVITIFPKVQMPEQPHGFLKVNEFDCY